MEDLYKEFMNWVEYNFPGVEFTSFQHNVLRSILKTGVPRTSTDLAQRLKKLLPKARK